MKKNCFFQVIPVWVSYPLVCTFFVSFIFGITAILLSQNGFLHFIN